MTDMTAYEQIIERRARAMAISAWMEKGYSEAQVAGFWDTGEHGTIRNKSHYRKRAIAAFDSDEAAGLVIVQEASLSRVRMALAFLMSTVKSGEPWTCVVQATFDDAVEGIKVAIVADWIRRKL